MLSGEWVVFPKLNCSSWPYIQQQREAIDILRLAAEEKVVYLHGVLRIWNVTWQIAGHLSTWERGRKRAAKWSMFMLILFIHFFKYTSKFCWKYKQSILDFFLFDLTIKSDLLIFFYSDVCIYTIEMTFCSELRGIADAVHTLRLRSLSALRLTSFLWWVSQTRAAFSSPESQQGYRQRDVGGPSESQLEWKWNESHLVQIPIHTTQRDLSVFSYMLMTCKNIDCTAYV